MIKVFRSLVTLSGSYGMGQMISHFGLDYHALCCAASSAAWRMEFEVIGGYPFSFQALISAGKAGPRSLQTS